MAKIVSMDSVGGSARFRPRWSWDDLGGVPLLVTLPFMYYPKMLAGDTQLWVFFAGLLALFAFHLARFPTAADMLTVLLSVACFGVYAIRSDDGLQVVRALHTYVCFIVLWLVCRRDYNGFFGDAVRLTVVVWLVVGCYQYFALALRLPVEIVGRYVEGRGGVPSLTPEPSIYGSLSVLQIMYLLTQHDRKNWPYIVAAAISVILSGSALAQILMVFPVLELSVRFRIALLITLTTFALFELFILSGSLVSRLLGIVTNIATDASVLFDSSSNLRMGHLVFTMGTNFVDSMLLLSPLNFMGQYNSFAQKTGLFIDTESNFILPALGEMIYGCGVFGMLLFARVIYLSQLGLTSTSAKFKKMLFITLCMLNPISCSNAFFILYLSRRN